MKTTSKVGIDLIKEFEGFMTDAYYCPAGVLTIGYGHTKGVTEGMKITHEEGEAYLKDDLRRFETFLNKIDVVLNQNQFDALISFIYNLGEGNFNSSTLKRKILNDPEDKSIYEEFMRWNKIGGKVSKGLLRRREKEAKLYFGYK